DYAYTAEHFSNAMRKLAKALGDSWNESEETEVKKDLEWLKEEVLELQNNGNAEVNQTEAEREIGRLQKWAWDNCADRVYELIDQLDEPEVLSPKWIEDNEFLVNDESGVDYTV